MGISEQFVLGKKPLRVYLAGPIQGVAAYPLYFSMGANRLREEGHEVYNPAAANQEGRALKDIMKHLLPQLCECEAIALLPGWWKSGGARIEWLLAKYLKLKVIYL